MSLIVIWVSTIFLLFHDNEAFVFVFSLPEDDVIDHSAKSEKRHSWAPVPLTSTPSIAQQRSPGRRAMIHQSMADLRVTEEEVKRRK